MTTFKKIQFIARFWRMSWQDYLSQLIEREYLHIQQAVTDNPKRFDVEQI